MVVVQFTHHTLFKTLMFKTVFIGVAWTLTLKATHLIKQVKLYLRAKKLKFIRVLLMMIKALAASVTTW